MIVPICSRLDCLVANRFTTYSMSNMIMDVQFCEVKTETRTENQWLGLLDRVTGFTIHQIFSQVPGSV